MVWADGYVEPQLYGAGTGTTYEAHGVLHWTGLYPSPLWVDERLVVAGLSWAGAPSAGSPQAVFELYAYGNATDRACNCARFTFTPNFSGNNTVDVDLFEMDADGDPVGTPATHTFTSGVGTNGDFGSLALTARFKPDSDGVEAEINNLTTGGLILSDWAGGNRIGFGVHYVEGTSVTGTSPGGPHVTFFEGPDFEDDFARPPGSGWQVNPMQRSVGPMIVEGGTMRPPVDFDGEFSGGTYRAAGAAQWVSEFDGDQVIEADLTGMSMPDVLAGPSHTSLKLYLKGNGRDLRSVAATVDYIVDWSPDHCYIVWALVQYGPSGETIYDPNVFEESYGEIDLGVTDGVFPDPATWRLEADTAGDVRLYHQGTLLGHAEFPDIPQGGRIGVYLDWGAGGPPAATHRPTVARITRLSGGLREPLGTEELGLWIRIGVDHTTLGHKWFFRGFVDALVPTYVPDRPDAVRIECIDSLGEAGRVFVDGDRLPDPFAMAPNRIRQILRRAHWPHRFWNVFDDATLMSRPGPGKAVDALTQVAESCGGAVYGDPATGDVVFKGQDWQGSAAAGEATAWITNWHPDVDIDGLPRICPTGWERSSRRADMNTRVRFTSEASTFGEGEPIIKEWRAPQAEALYGVELYERTLLAATGERLNQLARRQLRLRHPNQFPRIEAVLLDAATEPEALDLMTTATWTRPDKFGCQLRRGDGFVFNRRMLVTGVRHQMSPTRWTCRLALDPASVFAEYGGRWGEARWSRGEWGRTR